jgi:hypothetical protein
MERDVNDHPANEDDGDRHGRHRRVPTIVVIVAALLAVAALAFVRSLGVNW